MIYLDNAATSWPKPPQVIEAMSRFLEQAGGNPGRSGHQLSIEAGRAVHGARELLAELFHAGDPLRVVLLPNVTYALNVAIQGLLRPGDHVVTSSMEHNSVMRPLRALEHRGVQISVVPCANDGTLDAARLEAAVCPSTRLVVLLHASNVVGTLMPVAQVAQIAHAHGAKLLLDAAQTAGAVPMDMGALGVDLLAFTGHKGLLGPPGTGGLILGKDVDADEIEPLVAGGTGSNSEREEQPGFLPDKFESGTANSVGIAGLAAGIRYIMERGVAHIRAHELRLTRLLLDGLRPIPGVTLYGPEDPEQRTAVISFRGEGWRVSEIGLRLDDEFGVLARVGLHCAPAAHRTLGTFPEGTVRLAPGVFTSEDDVEQTVAAVGKVMTA